MAEESIGTLSDGRMLIVRDKSSDGKLTMETQRKSEKGKLIDETKFCYDERD